MAAKVTHTERISLPAMTLIGKTGSRWGQWWSSGWFDMLENLPVKSLDPDYLGVTAAEYWIGMLFPAGTAAPEGFEALHIPAGDYALHYLYGKEDAPDMYGSAALGLCAQTTADHGMTQVPGAILERYNCPRFTTPDTQGNVIIDYLVPVQ